VLSLISTYGEEHNMPAARYLSIARKSKLRSLHLIMLCEDIDDESDGDDVMILFFSWDGTTSKRDVSE
jgi:hypothetical protein